MTATILIDRPWIVALARERAQNYPMPAEHYDGCEQDHIRCLLERLADRIELLEQGRADFMRMLASDSRALRRYAEDRDAALRERNELRIEVRQLRDALERESADRLRLDWLADPKNDVGQVLLPTAYVEQNPASMRDAIDAAMRGAK